MDVAQILGRDDATHTGPWRERGLDVEDGEAVI